MNEREQRIWDQVYALTFIAQIERGALLANAELIAIDRATLAVQALKRLALT